MVKIKEVVEEKKEVVEDEDEDEDEDDIEVEGGIFDDDFDDINEVNEASDFDISTTILSSSSPTENWSNKNLENISRENFTRDWTDNESFVNNEIYSPSSSSANVYNSSTNDLYKGSKGSDLYSESGVGGAYGSSKKGYDGQSPNLGALKSHERLHDEHKGSSMLESMGFEDSEKRKHDKFARDFVELGGE